MKFFKKNGSNNKGKPSENISDGKIMGKPSVDVDKRNENVGKPSKDIGGGKDMGKPNVDITKSISEDFGKLILLEGMKLKNEGKYKESFTKIQEAASQYDNVVAQHALGFMYERGIGVGIDYKESFIWYKRAAEKGYAEAQNSVGCCYELGNGVEEDYNEAMHWMKLAADQGFVRAQANLGHMYGGRRGAPLNQRESFKWFLKASQNKVHYADAIYRVGLAYQNGLGVERDLEQAAKHFQSIADEDNHKVAQFKLGLYYLNGFGVATNFKQAFDWLIKSDYPESILCVGYMYEKGLGMEQDTEKANYYYDRISGTFTLDSRMFNLGMHYLDMNVGEKGIEQALFWFERAAEEDNVQALVAAGSIYLAGCSVDKKDNITKAYKHLSRAADLQKIPLALRQLQPTRDHKPEEKYNAAIKWYYKSVGNNLTVKEGCISGQSCLGYLYHKGLGVRQNFSKAKKIYHDVLRSKDEDDSDANMCLGLLYSKGLGVEQDHRVALKYFMRSAKSVNTYTYNLIGDAYKFGHGVEKDHEKAVAWYMKGVNYGDRYSQLNIGKMHLDNSKPLIALDWIEKSYDGGCQEALQFLQSLADQGYKTTKQLLKEERTSREAAEKELNETKAELASIKAELARMKAMASSESAVPVLSELKIEDKHKKPLQFFHV